MTVPANTTVILDVTPPALGGLTINGKLAFAAKDLQLSAKWIMVHGTLQVGTAASPYAHQAIITLTGSDPNESAMDMGTRGIMVMGGTLDLHGVAPFPAWTKLNANAAAGARSLTLKDNVDWEPSEQLVIAPTDYYHIGGTEVLTVASRVNNSVTLAAPLAQARWGTLQYVSETGVTARPTSSVTSTVIDERAEVANLTRNIIIQAPDDALWRNDGFGAHVMFMTGGVAHVQGVHFRRMGQAGRLGRYPMHWHTMSYSTTGQELGDLSGHYVRDSVIAGSSQRCLVIHATNGLTVTNNICYDIKGHAIFLEDAVERRNVIDGNLVLKVRTPSPGKALLRHEMLNGARTGPAGFWLTNPDNIVRNNAVADAEGMGYWLAYPRTPLGLSKAVRMEPFHLPFGVFDGNVAHSNKVLGFQADQVPINDAGDTAEVHYIPLSNGVDAPFTLSRLTTYKEEQPLWHRVRKGTLSDFVVADYNGIAFKGASQQCKVTRSLVVGTTLNNTNGSLERAAPMGAASYHSECDITNNVFVNLPAVRGRPSGAFDTADYYTSGLDKGLRRNTNNTFINTHPGYRSASPSTLASGAGHENWALAGALWDPHGLWGTPGSYWVQDLPFFTHGATCTNVTNPVHGNDKTCAGPYYGFNNIRPDNFIGSYDNFTAPVLYRRTDNNADYLVDDGACTWRLGWMRNTAMVKNGTYTVTFPRGASRDDRGTCSSNQLAPALAPPRRLSFQVTNLLNADDGFLVGVAYAGNAVPTVYRTTWSSVTEVTSWESWRAWKAGDSTWKSKFRGEFWQPITRASSLAEVRSGSGNKYWQDSANNLVWILVRNGLTPVAGDANSDQELYRTVSFMLDASQTLRKFNTELESDRDGSDEVEPDHDALGDDDVEDGADAIGDGDIEDGADAMGEGGAMGTALCAVSNVGTSGGGSGLALLGLLMCAGLIFRRRSDKRMRSEEPAISSPRV